MRTGASPVARPRTHAGASWVRVMSRRLGLQMPPAWREPPVWEWAVASAPVCLSVHHFLWQGRQPRLPFLWGRGFPALTHHFPGVCLSRPHPLAVVLTCPGLFVSLHARYVRSTLCNHRPLLSQVWGPHQLSRMLARVPNTWMGPCSGHPACSYANAPPFFLHLPPSSCKQTASSAWPKAGPLHPLLGNEASGTPKERQDEARWGIKAKAGGWLGQVPQK